MLRTRLVAGEVFSDGPGVFGSVPGVFWTHTPGEVGQPDFPLERRLLTSHYWSGGIPAPVSLPPPRVPCVQLLVPFVRSAPACPFCSSRSASALDHPKPRK